MAALIKLIDPIVLIELIDPIVLSTLISTGFLLLLNFVPKQDDLVARKKMRKSRSGRKPISCCSFVPRSVARRHLAVHGVVTI